MTHKIHMPTTKVVYRDDGALYRLLKKILPERLFPKTVKYRRVMLTARFKPELKGKVATQEYFTATSIDDLADEVSFRLYDAIHTTSIQFHANVLVRRGRNWYKVAYIRTPVNTPDGLIVTAYTL